VVAARLAAQAGYDRFVLEFDRGIPNYRITRQDNANFIQDGSGKPIALPGSFGLLIDLRPTVTTGSSGSTDLKLSHNGDRVEARQTGNFEGVTHWGIGLDRGACFRTFTLDSPPRLVVDIAAPA
jgi:hypothetical protein